MRKSLVRILAIGALLAVSVSAAAAAKTWSQNFEKSIARAKTEQKLMLLDFTGSDWCPGCIALEKEVFSQAAFKDYAAKNLVLMTVDFPMTREQPDALKAQNEKLREKYRVDGFPTVVVLNAAGKQVGVLNYMPGGPAAFIAALEKLKK